MTVKDDAKKVLIEKVEGFMKAIDDGVYDQTGERDADWPTYDEKEFLDGFKYWLQTGSLW